MLPLYDLTTEPGRAAFDERYRRLRASGQPDAKTGELVARIIDDVRTRGDDAVVEYMRRWTDPGYTRAQICVSEQELERAAASIPATLRDALAGAIENVRAYQSHLAPQAPAPIQRDGAELGMFFSPVDSVGLLVPGGRALYPSTVIMQAIPAQVAGVPNDAIVIATPPPTRAAGEAPADLAPVVLAACRMVGVRKVFRIGGAQAVAALVFGTETVPRVDMVAGPGNAFVQMAKMQLCAQVGIDGFYGPSEILIIADAAANVARIAADLIAEAEHDPGKCFLVSWQPAVIDAIRADIVRQLAKRGRREVTERALAEESFAVLVADAGEAAAVSNRIAPEHVTVATRDVDALVPLLRHAGEILIGDDTPMAAGDYWSGPSHCLPTGTTARFTSGLSPYTFCKRVGTIRFRGAPERRVLDAIAALAEAEGLDGHAESARVRRA